MLNWSGVFSLLGEVASESFYGDRFLHLPLKHIVSIAPFDMILYYVDLLVCGGISGEDLYPKEQAYRSIKVTFAV